MKKVVEKEERRWENEDKVEEEGEGKKRKKVVDVLEEEDIGSI